MPAIAVGLRIDRAMPRHTAPNQSSAQGEQRELRQDAFPAQRYADEACAREGLERSLPIGNIHH